MSTTHNIKFEDSPTGSLADSFISTPGTQYPSLFADNTMGPVDVMTPQSYEDDSMFGGSIRGDSVLGDSPAPEKKQAKKRKSWGQQLPEPKTNLPPRKRAKTEDEKEQRRVERVLRNRRAAQSSRERKRQEVEALEAEKQQIERKNQDLEMRLAHMQEQNMALQQQLAHVTGNKIPVFRSSSVTSTPGQELRQEPVPVTFSQDLFGSRESNAPSTISRQSISEQSVQTINPASLSPEMRPVVESTNASSSDMTQHPAVSVGRTTALDGFTNNHNFSHLSNIDDHFIPQHDFSGFFDAPNPSESDHQFLENGLPHLTDNFNLDFNHMDSHNDSFFNDEDFNDFLNHDDQLATETQSSDKFAETTASLQPQLGASFNGCDSGGNAVSV